jgi:DNA modification methylase
VVAKQLNRNSVGIEIDPAHVELITRRIEKLRLADDISSQYNYYKYTPNLNNIWKSEGRSSINQKKLI